MPMRPGESPEQFDTRLRNEHDARVAAAMSRVDELRNLRRSLSGTSFASDGDAFIKAQGGDPAAMATADAASHDAARAARETAAEERPVAQAQAEREFAAGLDTLSAAEMDENELAAFERKHGLSPSRRY